MAKTEIGEINTQIRCICSELQLGEVDRAKFRKLIYGFLGDRNESVVFEVCKDITSKIDNSVVSFGDLYVFISARRGGIRKLSAAVFEFILTISHTAYASECMSAFQDYLASKRDGEALKMLKNKICARFHALRIDFFEHYDQIRRNTRLLEDMSHSRMSGDLDRTILHRWQQSVPPAPVRFNNFVTLAMLLAFAKQDTRHLGYHHLLHGEDDIMTYQNANQSLLDTLSAEEVAAVGDGALQPDFDQFELDLVCAQSGQLQVLSKAQEATVRLIGRSVLQGHHVPYSILRIVRFQPLQNKTIQQRRVNPKEAEGKIKAVLETDDDRDYEASIAMVQDCIQRIEEICQAFAYCNLKLGRLPASMQQRVEQAGKQFEAAYKKVKRRKGAGATFEEVAQTLSCIYQPAISLLDQLRTLHLVLIKHQVPSVRKTQYEQDREIFLSHFSKAGDPKAIQSGESHA